MVHSISLLVSLLIALDSSFESLLLHPLVLYDILDFGHVLSCHFLSTGPASENPYLILHSLSVLYFFVFFNTDFDFLPLS